jgi:glycosyltransferase involved in cell wall biosynthesis
VVGTVGRGRPEKGFQYLVEAAPKILERHPGVVFALVGSGTERLLPSIRAHGLEERFRLTGHRTDAVDVMGLFDVFVLPSIGMDSCPNVLLEAMGMGLPVVGSQVGGIGEIIEDGATGRVVAPGDPGAIATAVVDLLDDPASAQATGQRARDLLQERFIPEVKVRETLLVYAKVLER